MRTTSYDRTDGEPRAPAPSIVVRWLLGIIAVFAVAALLAVVGGALFIFPKWSSDRAAANDVAQLVAELRAAGQPMTAADLDRFHAPSAGAPDSTPAWLAAQKLCAGGITKDGMGLPYVGIGKPDQLRPDDGTSQLAAADQFLANHDSALKAILAAAQESGECRYAVKFEQAPLFTTDATQGVRSLIHLLSLDVHVKAIRDESEAALKSLAAMFAASDSISHQVTLVEQLVRLPTLGAAMRQVELLLNELPLDDDQLAQISRRLEATDIQGSFTRALIGERAVANEAFNQMPRAALLGVEHQRVLETMTGAIARSSEELPGARDRFVADIAKAESAQPAGWSRPKATLSDTHVRTLATAFDAYAKAVAYRDGLLAAIAAERYRLRTERFPAQLDDLVPGYLPSAPTDPFTGKPFRFQSSDGQIVISSVGPNGKDDTALSSRGVSNDDIMIRVPAIKATQRKIE